MIYASFVISFLALVVLVWYAWLTRGIEKAANEQSEGLSKPVIVVVSSPDIPSDHVDEAILGEGGLFSEITDGVQLLNIGAGPALRVRWSATGQHITGESQESRVEGFVPYVQPPGTVDTECTRAFVSGLKSLRVTCTYKSLGGRQYTSRTVIGDQDSTNHADRFKIVSFGNCMRVIRHSTALASRVW